LRRGPCIRQAKIVNRAVERCWRIYGMSPVEQIALTVNIALRRDAATLDYYRTGSSPDAFATLPKEWTADQIRSFQDYFAP
jgi:hypothetical protein